MAYVNTARAAAPSFRSVFANPLNAVAQMVQRRRIFNQTVAELNSLSDRDLADLGLHRSLIRSVAKDAAYGK